jgi:hypothetical protein
MTGLRNGLHTGGRRSAAKSAVDSHGKEAVSLAELKIPAWVSQASRLTINTRILQTVLLHSLATEAGQERNRNLQITDQGTGTFISSRSGEESSSLLNGDETSCQPPMPGFDLQSTEN